VAEDRLRVMYDEAKAAGKPTPQIFIVRPAAITGPRGRFMRIRFGLQSALQGNLKKGFINRIVMMLTTFIPATKGWVRQFIHEDDVTDIMMLFTFEPFSQDYGVFNMTPESDLVLITDMAAAVGKRILPIQPWMARLAFFCFWHATRGRVPTAPHSWRFYSYPIVMSGTKLAIVYECKYSSKEAIQYTDGRYADWVPEGKRKSKQIAA
jgi:nucleoside-diphosphate-sugar epimerase